MQLLGRQRPENIPAFNEAEARKPRMQLTPQTLYFFANAFNEAEARKPRMRAIRPRSSARRYTFNEAEARKPRMRSRSLSSVISPSMPSMRPRLVSLGCAPIPRTAQALPEAFNEAEARKPRMPVPTSSFRPRLRRTFNEAEARKPRMPTHLQPVASQGNLAVFSRDSLQRRSNSVPSCIPTCLQCQRAIQFQHVK